MYIRIKNETTILMISVYMPKRGVPGCMLMLSSPLSPRISLSLTGAHTLMLQFSSLPTLHSWFLFL